jgi:tetratricopeptide (TPR) repeat protein
VGPPRSCPKQESFWSTWRKHLKEQLAASDFLNYSLLCLAVLLLCIGWRTFFSPRVLLIAPFSAPAGGETVIGMSGKSAANLLLDEIDNLSMEANGYGKGAKTAPFLNTERSLEMPDVKLDVAGFSVEGILGLISRLLEKQEVVTGEIYWLKDGVSIRARLENNMWTVGPFSPTAVELNKQYRSLATQILSATNPNIAGLIFQKDGQISAAIESFRRWLSLSSLDNNAKAQANFHLGVAYYLNGDAARAEQCYRTALSFQPKLFEAVVNLGFLYMGTQSQKAAKRFEEASELRPNSLMPLMLLGLTQTDPADKEATYRKAVALYPDMPETHHELGMVLQQMHKQQEADEQFRIEQEETAKSRAPAPSPEVSPRHDN